VLRAASLSLVALGEFRLGRHPDPLLWVFDIGLALNGFLLGFLAFPFGRPSAKPSRWSAAVGYSLPVGWQGVCALAFSLVLGGLLAGHVGYVGPMAVATVCYAWALDAGRRLKVL